VLRRVCLAASLFLGAACTCDTDAGSDVFACTSDSDCLKDFKCASGVCVSMSGSGGGGQGGGAGGGSACGCHGCEDCSDAGTCVLLGAGSSSPPCDPYVCDGISRDCPTMCSTGASCATGADCISGHCHGVLDAGTMCVSDGQCSSGHCADQVCCESACAAPCDVCNTPGFEGQCLPAFAGAAGDPSCAPYVCSGADAGCPTRCSGPADCVQGAPCLNGQCQRLGDGAQCMSDAECQSTHCVDGFCCAALCGSSCDRCDVPTAGMCSPAPSGSAGAPSCGLYLCDGTSTGCPTKCAADGDCAASAYCDGGQCLGRSPNGAPCLGAGECVSGHCADGVCCDLACTGGCLACNVPGDAGACLPFAAGSDPKAACTGGLACNGNGGCNTSCTTAAQCESPYICYQGQCVQDLPNGADCMQPTDCQSHLCQQGKCCSATCGGCTACNSAGSCGNAAAGTDPNQACPGGLTCAGNGSCSTSCSASAPCEAGYACSAGGVCQKTQGAVCGADSECASAHCIDGVCCATTCIGTCKSCNRPGNAGVCGNVASGQDPDQECAGGLACNGSGGCYSNCFSSMTACESTYYCDFISSSCKPKFTNGTSCGGIFGGSSSFCLSGFCRDSVCCDSACTSACQSCNQNGSAGTCVDFARGTDPNNECGPSFTCTGDGGCLSQCTSNTDCKAGSSCSGTGLCLRDNGQNCNQGTSCLSGLCVDGKCCNTACSGACDACNLGGSVGTCTKRSTGSQGSPTCYPFVCNGSASCPAACSSPADCVAGSTCVNSQCLLPNGDSCGTGGECQSTLCVDQTCCNNMCGGTCMTCASGACSAIPAGQDPGGECAGGLACNGSGGCNTSCSADTACEQGYFCQSPSCVLQRTNGAPCSTPNQCQSGVCVDSVCCSSACNGTCQACNQASSPGACAPYLRGSDPDNECSAGYECSGGSSCLTTCASSTDCKLPYACDAGLCAL
jgi:hypothetical protein